MAALTDNIEVKEKDGILVDFPVAVDIIYRGALCKINAAGYLAPCATESGSFFAGIAMEEVDNSAGSAGDKTCKVMTKGSYLLTSSGLGQDDLGSPVYATDDQLVGLTDTGDLQRIGRMVKYVSATQMWVQFPAGVSVEVGSVVKADLDSGISASHMVVYSGSHTTAGGDAAEVITVTGALATDVAVCMLHTEGSSPVTLDAAAAATDAINVTMSGDPSTDHVIKYVVFRATS